MNNLEFNNLKTSQYNLIYKEGNKHYIFNFLSCGFAELEKDAYLLLEKFSNKNNFEIKEEDCENKLIEEFIKGGFVIPKDLNEINLLKYLVYQNRFTMNNVSFTILPTYACNLKCTYCFQEHTKNITMNDEVMAKITEHAEDLLKEKYKSVNITWYGGEPLLAPEVIDILTTNFLKICKKYKVPYRSSMVTNGVLMDHHIVKKFEKWHVSEVQITIDGPKEIHDQRRITKKNEGTYEVIMKNIEYLVNQQKHPIVNIRINVDRRNYSYLMELIKDFGKRGILDKLPSYIAPVTRTTKSCGDIAEHLLNFDELNNIEISFLKNVIKSNLPFVIPYPKKSASQCMAVTTGALVIGPEGLLWRCWDVVGRDEESIGNIKTGIKVNDTFLKWSVSDPFADEECLSCKIFPVCLGGCSARRVPLNKEHFTAVFQKKCSLWRKGAIEYLKLIVKLNQNREKLQKINNN